MVESFTDSYSAQVFKTLGPIPSIPMALLGSSSKSTSRTSDSEQTILKVDKADSPCAKQHGGGMVNKF